LVTLEKNERVMNHYLDISLLPDPEFPALVLMDALFAKLHRALVAVRSQEIGVSFPEVRMAKAGLGGVLRLHGSHAHLRDFMAAHWLTGIRDHVTLSPTQAVPSACSSYCTVSRVQVKSNPERERRRLMRRKGLTEVQAREKIPDASAKALNLPYLHMRSQSTGQSFNLFIQHGAVVSTPVKGVFGMYGLSASTTVPWF
jgi:CRISPR-associated endonuclease Csy4